MSVVDLAISNITAVSQEIGPKEFAQRAGVPYTTLLDSLKSGFGSVQLENLRKLSAAAEAVRPGELGAFVARVDDVAERRGVTRAWISKKLFGYSKKVDGLAKGECDIGVRRLARALQELSELDPPPDPQRSR